MTGPAGDGGWLDLCHAALDVPLALPPGERRRRAAAALLVVCGEEPDLLGVGAAEAAIDLVVRYGDAGRLDEILLRWEQADLLAPEAAALRAGGDPGTALATVCARALLKAVIDYVERGADGSPPA